MRHKPECGTPPLTHKYGDELTASKWVRGHPLVANIWHAAQPLPPFRRVELVLPPPHGDKLTASGARALALAAQSGDKK